ncbi:extracellular solute-binding protein [Halobacteriaceae archaeon GCM10025711]
MSVEVLAGQSDTAQSQFSQWLSAGLEQPSLLRMDSGWTIPFILRDQVANLSEALPDVASTVKDEYFDATVSTVTGPDGDVFGVPLFSDFGLMLYRKDLVEQAGFDPSGWATSPLSWERFARITDETKRNADTDYGFTFQAMVYEGLSCCTFTEFMTTHGGSYFGARENLIGNVDERPVTVDADPVLRANRMVRTFIHGPDDPHALDEFAGPIAPTAVLSWSESPSLSAFTDGNAVMHRNWPYSVLSAGAKDAFGENLGVMPIPYGVRPGQAAFPGMGGSRSALGGWHVTLNPNAKHRDAALEVLKAMSADSFNLKLMEVLGYVPPKPGLLDTREARNVPVMGRYVDTLRFAGQHAMPRPVSVVWPLESPRIAQKVSASFSGSQSPERAMTDLAGLLTDIENSANKPPS